MQYRLRSERDRSCALTDLQAIALPARMELHTGDDRSAEQNRLMWRWLHIIGTELGMSIEEARRLTKLTIGVPILRRDSEDFCVTYDRLIKPMQYEDKLAAMDLIDVTSIMRVRQMQEFLDNLQMEYASKGVQLNE